MPEQTVKTARMLFWSEREPETHEDSNLVVSVFGRPILPADQPDILSHLDAYADTETAAGHLDGEFALIAESETELELVSDPFGSVPLYYAQVDDEYVVTPDYLLLWQYLRNAGVLTVDEGAFVEFTHFQRLFGERTYDGQSQMLPGGSVLRVSDGGNPVCNRYISPSTVKRSRSVAGWGRVLAQRLQRAVDRRLAGVDACSLLLSGGLDSRAILGAIPDGVDVTTYTIGDFRNNEVEVAEKLAAAAGVEHEFVSRPDGYYEDCLERAVRVGGGTNTFSHAHFFFLKDALPDSAGPLLHGHGLDYLFQGMYLPTRQPQFLGHSTFLNRLDDIGTDVANTYQNRISYRLTDGSLERVLSDKGAEARRNLSASLESVLRTAPDDFPEQYDRWDYLHTVDQSRHYTHLNLLSIPPQLDPRTPAFDRGLFELFWEIPAAKRKDGGIVRAAIRRLDPSLLEVRDANTNLPADAGPLELTLRATGHAIARRLPFLTTSHRYPDPSERSWPQRDTLVRDRPELRQRAMALGTSDLLASLSVFDLEAIDELVSAHMAGTDDYGPGILTLITVDEFLRQGGLP